MVCSMNGRNTPHTTTEHGEVVPGADLDGAVGIVAGSRTIVPPLCVIVFTVASSPKRGGHDVAVLGARGRRDEHVVVVEDPAADHRLALDAQEEHVVGGQEAAVHREVSDPVVGINAGSRRAPGRSTAPVAWSSGPRTLRCGRRGERGLIALDEPLQCQRAEEVRDRLRRLDAKLLRDLADAGFGTCSPQEVDQVVVHPTLEGVSGSVITASPASIVYGRARATRFVQLPGKCSINQSGRNSCFSWDVYHFRACGTRRLKVLPVALADGPLPDRGGPARRRGPA